MPSSSARALGAGFALRRGLASSTRFSTPELDTLATVTEDASSRANATEQVTFAELLTAVLAQRDVLTKVGTHSGSPGPGVRAGPGCG